MKIRKQVNHDNETSIRLWAIIMTDHEDTCINFRPFVIQADMTLSDDVTVKNNNEMAVK